jgi:phosphatidylserine decarboxylase
MFELELFFFGQRKSFSPPEAFPPQSTNEAINRRRFCRFCRLGTRPREDRSPSRFGPTKPAVSCSSSVDQRLDRYVLPRVH